MVILFFSLQRRPNSRHSVSSSTSAKLPTLSADQRARLTKLMKPRPLPKELLYSKWEIGMQEKYLIVLVRQKSSIVFFSFPNISYVLPTSPVCLSCCLRYRCSLFQVFLPLCTVVFTDVFFIFITRFTLESINGNEWANNWTIRDRFTSSCLYFMEQWRFL